MAPSEFMFTNSANKLKREQKERMEKARQKAEKERQAQQKVRESREAMERELQRKRLAEAAAIEAERLRHEQEVLANNGVWWTADLIAVPYDEDETRERGIKRGAGKEIHFSMTTADSAAAFCEEGPDGPRHDEKWRNVVRDQVRKRGASGNGGTSGNMGTSGNLGTSGNVGTSGNLGTSGNMGTSGNLGTSGNGRTHAGVLDFTAVEGTVGLPSHTARNVFGNSAIPSGQRVTVTYRKLPKGTYCRLQPLQADFHQDVRENVREVLEAALFTHSTLTEGDWISVDFGGRAYDLRVQQLEPAPQVSVIDTDLAADVETSMETEQRLREEAEAAERRLKELERLEAQAAAAQAARLQASAEAAQLRQSLLQDKEAALAPEPPPDSSEPITTCQIRLPDGSRISRRFTQSAPLEDLFAFVDAKGAGGLDPCSYQLVAQYPRRTIAPGCAPTLAAAGLRGQEALLLVPCDG